MFWSSSRDLTVKLSVLAAALVLPGSVVLAAGASAEPNPAEQPGVPAVEGAPAPELLPAPEAAPVADAAANLPSEGLTVLPAAHVDVAARALPPGDCPEHGLQIKTILAERAISAEFPQINSMIGVRPDAKPWHPNGLAIDVMIPNPGSASGIALGNAIRDYALRNADRFAIQDVIWRGTYYTPGGGPSGGNYGHYDHVHITTHGGGYPTGGEEYLAEG